MPTLARCAAALVSVSLACGDGAALEGRGRSSVATAAPDPAAIGCSDGTREGFRDLSANPNIAGCSGGWSIPGINNFNPTYAPICGIATFETRVPACGRQSGNSSGNPAGAGCNVADLCAAGWHVCQSAREVAKLSPAGCAGATSDGDPPLFFSSRQTSNGCGVCDNGERTDADCNSGSCTTGCAPTPLLSNDLFGCGNFGSTAPLVDCGPFDRFSQNDCSGLQPSSWNCDSPYGLCEAYTATKADADFGGVLCCRDCVAPGPAGNLLPDSDCDGVADVLDNCPLTFNPDQADACHAGSRPDVSKAAASQPCLWPPNHKVVAEQITGITDPDGLAVTVAIDYIQQDEPVSGLGSGDTAPDGRLDGATAWVRAERSGTADGRVYHL
ncbi:MAG: hypothetical protein ACXWLM_13085, partial [Myxococcales bacterium]